MNWIGFASPSFIDLFGIGARFRVHAPADHDRLPFLGFRVFMTAWAKFFTSVA